MFDGFEGYRTATQDDYRDLLTGGLVVPDTNVLLDLYRYHEQTRNDLFAVLRSIGEHLWVPHQVMREFWRNREGVLLARRTDDTAQALTDQRDAATKKLREWANRVGLPEERVTVLETGLIQAFAPIIEDARKFADEMESARDTNRDSVIAELEKILNGRVGAALEQTEYEEAVAEGKRRVEAGEPPGAGDGGKQGDGPAGDYLVWVQVLREAERRRQNVLLVTGERKPGWWRREHGELRGPRLELFDELKALADVRLFIQRPGSLLVQARDALRINVRDESVKDIERVAQEDIKGWPELRTLSELVRKTLQEQGVPVEPLKGYKLPRLMVRADDIRYGLYLMPGGRQSVGWVHDALYAARRLGTDVQPVLVTEAEPVPGVAELAVKTGVHIMWRGTDGRWRDIPWAGTEPERVSTE